MLFFSPRLVKIAKCKAKRSFLALFGCRPNGTDGARGEAAVYGRAAIMARAVQHGRLRFVARTALQASRARHQLHHRATSRHRYIPNHGLHSRRQCLHPRWLRCHLHRRRLPTTLPLLPPPASRRRLCRLRGPRSPWPHSRYCSRFHHWVLHHGRLRQPSTGVSPRHGNQRLLRLYRRRFPRLRQPPLPHCLNCCLSRGPPLPYHICPGIPSSACQAGAQTRTRFHLRRHRFLPRLHWAAGQPGRGPRRL